MCRRSLYAFLLGLVIVSACTGTAQEITLANNNSSDYKIVVPAAPTKLEQRSASILQSYIQRISGAELPIVKDGGKDKMPGIYIGLTGKAEKVHPGKLPSESYFIHTDGNDIVICAGNGRGLAYGVYSFIETYLHCRKISNDPAILPESHVIKVPGRIHNEYKPPLVYREVYYPASHDAEYLEWNQLQQLDDLWGVWGHSFNKLLPAKTYFSTHPEYYSLVKGKRQASQLCLSNEDVFKIIVNELKKKMADNPDAIYWSISPNDDNGYCQCDKCSAVDNEQGGPAGSLIKFVNRVAAVFPDKKITTLAYAYTHKAPRSIKPADNVYVFLSNIDAYRDKSLADEGSAAAFRNDLKAWGGITKNLFIWDYITQFTSYLAPFPNFNTLQPNMQYMKENGVKGIFAQGSGDTYGEWAELRSYVEAKLMQDDKADVQQLIASFLKDYYGGAAKYLQQYIDLVQEKMQASKRKLDIYGNPVNEWKSYLSPESIEQYGNLFDKAEGAVEGNATLQSRVMRARLPLEYTVLQQARFYGIEKHGVFVKANSGKWEVKPKFESKVASFVADCKTAGVIELSEAGPARKPDEYQAEWNAIFKAGVTPTKGLDAKVALQYPFAEDYPAKGNRTLIDGTPGYSDFSYNWLCFYGVPMVATIDLGQAQSVTKVKMHFLDDPRHWIFLPSKVTVEVSKDGASYHSIGDIPATANEEHYEVTVKEYVAQKTTEQVRYVRVTANNLASLPEWRYNEKKKAMIACDEIYVQ
ncbi:MAG: coagulation factor 5/8 type domain protein [Flavipsychrobacter sp.]|nr:coagulation factor 5/8 type domain protein [Flavipsychrobacter sp.]